MRTIMRRVKGLPLVIASALIVAQFAGNGMIAHAESIWVEDSTVEGGGYYMDENGYREDAYIGQEEGSNVQYIYKYEDDTTPIATYSNGVQEPYVAQPAATNDAGLVAAAATATTATISNIVSSVAGSQQFSITADGTVTYQFIQNGVLTTVSYTEETQTDGSIILSIPDATGDYMVYVYGADTSRSLANARSRLEQSYTVYYQLDSNIVITAATGTVTSNQGTAAHTAPERYSYNGEDYVRISGETQLITYGRSNSCTFQYEVYNPTPKTLTVNYVDARGNIVKTATKEVGYRSGVVTFDADSTFIADSGITYTLDDTLNHIEVNYFSPILTYAIQYRAEGQPNTDPYSVRVAYVNENNTVISEDFFSVSAADIASGTTISFQAPAELSLMEGDSMVYYDVDASTQNIQHAAADNQRNQYVVQYRRSSADAPYTWSIRLADLSTGNILETYEQRITVTQPGLFTVPASVQTATDTYILSDGMEREYHHQYAQSGRILYIYYYPESQGAVASYNLRVQYKSITDDSIIYTTTEQADVTQPTLPISAPENYTGTNGTEYVRLQGQDNMEHTFFSPQRTYTVYYRDASDIQNADVVVTREEVVTVGDTVVVPTFVDAVADAGTTDAGAAAAGAAAAGTEAAAVGGAGTTVLNNETSGETVTLDDEGVPLADLSDEQAGVNNIEDEEVPLADAQGVLASHSTGIILGVAALLGLGAGVFVLTRKKKEDEEN